MALNSIPYKNSLAIDFDGVVCDSDMLRRRWLVRNGYTDSEFVGPVTGSSVTSLFGEAVHLEMKMTTGYNETLECQPIQDSIESLVFLSKLWNIYIVTARESSKLIWASKWCRKYDLQKIIRGIFSSESYTKIEVAYKLQCCALVDNDIRHLNVSNSYKIQRYWLEPEHPPNLMISGILPVRSWRDLVLHLTATKHGQN